MIQEVSSVGKSVQRILVIPCRANEPLRDELSAYASCSRDRNEEVVITRSGTAEAYSRNNPLSSAVTELGVPAPRLSAGLINAYRHIIDRFQQDPDANPKGCVIVRLDNGEHPVREVERVAGAALAGGFCVAQPREVSRPSASRLAAAQSREIREHDRRVASRIGSISRDLAGIGGAHGYLAIRADKIGALFPAANHIYMTACAITHRALGWGFDASTILAARACGMRVTMLHYDAQEMRSATRPKMAEQFAAIDAIVEAFEVLQTAGSFDGTPLKGTSATRRKHGVVEITET